jgi:hypothetical protein
MIYSFESPTVLILSLPWPWCGRIPGTLFLLPLKKRYPLLLDESVLAVEMLADVLSLWLCWLFMFYKASMIIISCC